MLSYVMLRPDHKTGNSMPYYFRTMRGFLCLEGIESIKVKNGPLDFTPHEIVS